MEPINNVTAVTGVLLMLKSVVVEHKTVMGDEQMGEFIDGALLELDALRRHFIAESIPVFKHTSFRTQRTLPRLPDDCQHGGDVHGDPISGWVCDECGAALDRFGNAVEA